MQSNLKLILLGVIIMFISGVSIWALSPGSTPPIKRGGKVVPGSIATLEKIELGGMDQWIQIRGVDADNPVLLWLHGGPGASQMPVSHYYNGALEEEFVVVHWDQRGAGKSNPRHFDEGTMTIEQFVSDAHELTQYLKTRFNRDQIYLVGHSWGTHFGIKLVQTYPDDYFAYVAVSQVVHSVRAGEIAHAWLTQQVEQRGSEKDMQRLAELGKPPYTDHDIYVSFARMVEAYGGGMDVGMGKLAWISLGSSEYRLGDYIAWLRGATRGSGPMWKETLSFNMFQEVPQLLLPAYFFSGAGDYNTPIQLVEEYVAALDAPYGKRMVMFEKSAHNPFMGEPERFNLEMVRVKEETYR
jgi:pimeloyl-ACP methyl ester carboxylesterase